MVGLTPPQGIRVNEKYVVFQLMQNVGNIMIMIVATTITEKLPGKRRTMYLKLILKRTDKITPQLI